MARRFSPRSSKRRLRVDSAQTLNLEGDEQSDLTVHGGVDKAVYVYPSEHYEFWRRELPKMELPWSVFGENLTTEGLLESDVRIGDRFRIGSSEFVVTQPRMPCFKLGIRFGRPDILKRFLQSGRTGFYFAVALEGDVGAGDSIDSIAKAPDGLTVADVVNLYTVDAHNAELLHRGRLIHHSCPRAGKTTFARGSGSPILDVTDKRSNCGMNALRNLVVLFLGLAGAPGRGSPRAGRSPQLLDPGCFEG